MSVLFVFITWQEALWREEAVKKKLAVLQESTSNLVNSSDFIWTVRASLCAHKLLIYAKHTNTRAHTHRVYTISFL